MKKIILLSILGYCFAMVGCQKEEYGLPVLKDALQNDALKRKLGQILPDNILILPMPSLFPQPRGKLYRLR